MTWENPKPEAMVELLDLLPELSAVATPVLIAITVEESRMPVK